MKKILYLSLMVSLFFTHNAIATPTHPVIYEKIPVSTPTTDTTPNYTFNTDQDGTIVYGGSCDSVTTYAIAAGDITVTFNALAPGTYSDCTIVVKDRWNGFESNTITVSIFTIVDETSPTISEKTPVSTPTTDATPDYTFNTDEAGTIAYGGSCSSATTDATVGDNTITFEELPAGTYSDCTISVTDGVGNASNTLDISTFTIEGGAVEEETTEEEIVEEDDLVSGTTMQKYKRYKEKYKNQKSRNANKEMKGWKNGTAEEFAQYIEYRNIYKEYKHLSKPERKTIMTPEDYEKYQMYKRYKGYKEYKKLRDEVK